MNKNNYNQEIRKIIDNSKLKKYEIANEVGITVYTFSHWLQTDLNEERKTRILKAIEKLKNN